MLRSSTLLLSVLFVAAVGSAGCQLVTDGQGPALEVDASSASSVLCSLTCARGSRCEVRSEGAVCTPHDEPEADAGRGSTPPSSTPPSAVCNLACTQGTQCVVTAQGPSCAPSSDPADDDDLDAGEPDTDNDAGWPSLACTLSCVQGRHCQWTNKGQVCVSDDKPIADAGSETACGAETCAAGEKCCSASCGICEPRGSACPAIACPIVDAEVPKQTCANTTCPRRTYCDDISGTAECKQLPSCDTVKCSATTTCELVQVQCVRAPCPPQPQCVPKEPQVCSLACKDGQHCVLSGNGPTCEPDAQGVSCGKKTCSAGQVCCNASCGICGSVGGACITLACVSTEPY